jgi:hypothetical protein
MITLNRLLKKIDTRLAVLTWMVGVLLAVSLTTLARVWTIH